MLKTMHSSGRVYSVIYRAKSDKLIEFVMYIYTMRQKNCTTLFLQQLCHIFLCSNNYTYTVINLEPDNIKSSISFEGCLYIAL